MSAELSSIISVAVAITGVIASAIGGIFAYHKFLMKNLENVIKESLKEIKENMDKRDAEFKEGLKEMKADLKEDLKYIREKVFTN